ncbi:hypothetical protein B0H14DRAFT_2337221 [Mycena olivaceomarginata]|nr:hypothetical protein B0H14DRAFT_2337221 [Mycena olivaceomarginata]
MPAAVLLVQRGVFPVSPSKPRTAVSIDFLELYRALFERSCDAITAIAATLHTVYDRRGFRVYSQNNPGMRAIDPFRAPLSNAVLWSSNLRTRIRVQFDAALAAADPTVRAAPSTPSAAPSTPPPIPRPAVPPPPAPSAPPLTPGHAHRILQERCPACFGLETWGRPLSEGGDVQLGADGCFSYRHLKSVGDGPISYDPSYFISKEKVDNVRARIDEARKKPSANAVPMLPQAILDACEESFEAAHENKRKADPKYYDATGIFVISCRHSQVLFLCNIDTPGESQQYIVAAVEEVQSYLPPVATVLQDYDIGCIIDHSLNLFNILTPGLRPRVAFCTNAMHAFGHQWVCQIVYSPRIRPGCGLTDSEGVERFWSRIRKLIPLTRHQWNSRRIWLIDQYAAFVNEEGRDKLGPWLLRQQEKNLEPKLTAAKRILRQCRVPEAELRREWAAQKVAQSSMPPARVKRGLSKVLALQNQIDAIELSIQEVRTTIATTGKETRESRQILDRLERTHQTLNEQAELLYTSLNLPGSFPELKGLPLKFVHHLTTMRALKVDIRDRAIGTLFEAEALGKTMTAREGPQGTKLTQATKKAMARRRPALLRDVVKFNKHCEMFAELRPQGCRIPIPMPLPTDLVELRDDPILHQDIWTEVTTGPLPRWLEDADVRDGIRSLHVVDRCGEERRRLDLERENLRRWLKQELAIVRRAIDANGTHSYSVLSQSDHLLGEHLLLPLTQRLQELHLLSLSWAPALSRRQLPTPRAPAAAAAAAADYFDMPPTTAVRAPPRNDAATTPTAPLVPLSQQHAIYEDDDDDEDYFDVPPDPAASAADHMNSVTVYRDRLRRFVVGVEDRPTITIEMDDLDRLTTHRRRLNGCIINGVAAALQSFCSLSLSPSCHIATQCAVLSTYDLHRIRFNATDAAVWKHTKTTSYWEKPMWLIPIHRPDELHWVFVLAAVREQKLFFFDSLASNSGWRRDIIDVMLLIHRMVELANKHGHALHISTLEDLWEARPLFTGVPLQTNSYDCGAWVLCMMAAVMRGHFTTGVSEATMRRARSLLADLILTLPWS